MIVKAIKYFQDGWQIILQNSQIIIKHGSEIKKSFKYYRSFQTFLWENDSIFEYLDNLEKQSTIVYYTKYDFKATLEINEDVAHIVIYRGSKALKEGVFKFIGLSYTSQLIYSQFNELKKEIDKIESNYIESAE